MDVGLEKQALSLFKLMGDDAGNKISLEALLIELFPLANAVELAQFQEWTKRVSFFLFQFTS